MNKNILTAAIGAAMIVAPLAAQADLKISGRVAGELVNNTTGTLFGDTGHSRLQFDFSNGMGFARMAMDMRPLFGAGSPGARDAYLGLNFGSVAVSAGRIAGAVKNLEKDPFIATFLEMRGNSVKGGSLGSNSFRPSVINVTAKAGGAKWKVQTSQFDNTGTKGDLSASVSGKMMGAKVYAGYNNLGNSGNTFYKVGGSMDFGDVKGKLYYENDGGTGLARFVVGAEMGMG
ncbi:MAG: porin, partial [Gammaproteobacteria bacterium]